jgi:hypothetical protein
MENDVRSTQFQRVVWADRCMLNRDPDIGSESSDRPNGGQRVGSRREQRQGRDD